MKMLKNQNGFSAIDAILGALLLITIGVASYFAYLHHSKNTVSTNKTTSSVVAIASPKPSSSAIPTAYTSPQLIAVAKVVYSQDASSSEPTVNICGVGNDPACPFTSQLLSNLASFKAPVGFGPSLMGGGKMDPSAMSLIRQPPLLVAVPLL